MRRVRSAVGPRSCAPSVGDPTWSGRPFLTPLTGQAAFLASASVHLTSSGSHLAGRCAERSGGISRVSRNTRLNGTSRHAPSGRRHSGADARQVGRGRSGDGRVQGTQRTWRDVRATPLIEIHQIATMFHVTRVLADLDHALGLAGAEGASSEHVPRRAAAARTAAHPQGIPSPRRGEIPAACVAASRGAATSSAGRPASEEQGGAALRPSIAYRSRARKRAPWRRRRSRLPPHR